MGNEQSKDGLPMPPSLRWALAGISLVLAMVLAMAFLSVSQGRLSHEQKAFSQAENLSLVLERSIAAILKQADLSLLTVAHHVEDQLADRGLDGQALNEFLAHQQSLQPDLLSIRIADADGQVRFGQGLPGNLVSLAHRKFFLELKADPAAGLVVDGPVLAQISKQWVLVLARRINGPDGSFAGIVYANIATEHFGKLFAGMDLGRQGAATIRTADLALVARYPNLPGDRSPPGNTSVSAELKDALAINPLAGNYIATWMLDQVERANSYRRIAGYPLLVVIGLATEDFLGEWRSDAFQIAGLAGLVVLLTGVACWLFYLSWERQRANEAALRNEKEKLNLALSAARMEVFEYDLDKDRVNIDTDPILARGLGQTFSSDDYLARVHPGDKAGLLSAIAEMSPDTPTYKQRYRFLMPEGNYRWLMDQGRGQFDAQGRLVRVLGACWDVTSQREAETAAGEMNAELERRVKERTAQLSAANKQLEGFAYAVSHDLRGPLGRINTFSEMLEKSQCDRLDDHGFELLKFIRQNAIRLTYLVDDLLDHSRVAMETQQLQPVDLQSMFQAILEAKAEDIRKLGASVRLDLPPAQVLADPQHLYQALMHLLENALKYSTDASPPIIHIGAEETDGRLNLWVRDNGIGFDMKYSESIFDLFRRLHTYSDVPGSGIGLALVKRAVERMGGTVRAEGTPGQGAKFILELQAAEADSKAARLN